MGPFKTVQEIKAANKRAGKYFFSPATMAGFNSIVHDGVYGGRFFVVSNQFVPTVGKPEPREYRVCVAKDSGDVRYHSSEKYASLTEAYKAAMEAAGKQ